MIRTNIPYFFSLESIWIKILESFLSRELTWFKILESFFSREWIWIEILESHLGHESIWIKVQKPLRVMRWVGIKTFRDWLNRIEKWVVPMSAYIATWNLNDRYYVMVQIVDNSCAPFSLAGTAMFIVHGFVDPCGYILYPSDCFLSVCCRWVQQRPVIGRDSGDVMSWHGFPSVRITVTLVQLPESLHYRVTQI